MDIHVPWWNRKKEFLLGIVDLGRFFFVIQQQVISFELLKSLKPLNINSILCSFSWMALCGPKMCRDLKWFVKDDESDGTILQFLACSVCTVHCAFNLKL